MSGGLSIHAVDVARGLPAAGMLVSLKRCDSLSQSRAACRHELFADWPLDEAGKVSTLAFPKLEWRAGCYEATFSLADYYNSTGWTLPAVPFLDRFPFRFNVADAAKHHHLPLKMTPWGLSLFLTK